MEKCISEGRFVGEFWGGVRVVSVPAGAIACVDACLFLHIRYTPNVKIQFLIPIDVSSQRISPIVWSNSQENYRFIFLALAPRVLTFLEVPIFLTNKENHPKVSVHPRTAIAP